MQLSKNCRRTAREIRHPDSERPGGHVPTNREGANSDGTHPTPSLHWLSLQQLCRLGWQDLDCSGPTAVRRGPGRFLWGFETIQKEKCQASVKRTLLIGGCFSAVCSHTFCTLPLRTAQVQVAVREHDKGIKLQVGSRFPSLLVCMCVCLCFFCAIAQGGS